MFAYEDSTVMGLHMTDGQVNLKPSMDTIIQEGDKIIAISEDDDTVIVSGKKNFEIKKSTKRQI